MGLRHHGHPAGADRRNGAVHRQLPAVVADPPGAPHDVVRRRHTTVASHGHAGGPAGSWGRRGGYILPSALEIPKFPYTEYKHEPKYKADNPESLYPLADETLASGLCDATIPGKTPYELKGWMVYGTNLLQSLPNPNDVLEAIQALDFIVSIDILPAEICGWSDVVQVAVGKSL